MATETPQPFTVGDAKKQLRGFAPNHELFIDIDGKLVPIDRIEWHSFEVCFVAKAKS